MGNATIKDSQPQSSATAKPPSADLSGEDFEASRLEPKILEWLQQSAEKYSSTSVARSSLSGSGPGDSELKTVVRANQSHVEPEVELLETLAIHRPLFAMGSGADAFTSAEIRQFERDFPSIDLSALVEIFHVYQRVIAKESHKIRLGQNNYVERMKNTEVILVKTLHNFAALAVEFAEFESNMHSVFEIQHTVRVTHERVRESLKRTFRFVDLLEDDVRFNDLECPIEVNQPYLRKDQYTKTNFFKYTPWRKLQSIDERLAESLLEDEWLDTILPHWDEVLKTRRMGKFWRRGIPPRLRGYVWSMAISNVLNITVDDYMRSQEVAQRKRDESPDEDLASPMKVDHRTRRQGKALRSIIERDLPRTLPELGFFDRSESIAYSEILKVLETAAVFSVDIGYVQGFSYVAAVFLLFMDHFTAFKSFCNVMNAPFFRSLSHMDINHVSRHSQLFQLIFAHNASDLYEHFSKHDIAAEHFILDWWLTLFAKSAPLPVACRIWDSFFLEGEVFIHYVAVAMLKINEKQLLASNFEGCMELIPQIPKSVRVDDLMEMIESLTLSPKIEGVMEQLMKENELFNS